VQVDATLSTSGNSFCRGSAGWLLAGRRMRPTLKSTVNYRPGEGSFRQVARLRV
jgi:hypothetical protein